MNKITVFTPTYNRAYIIKNVYDSLLRQTYKDFEWLVIDDGSTDDTEELINGLIKEDKIKIRYYKKENGGQHTALNCAIEKSDAEMLMIVDSDDYLTDNALERVVFWESTIKDKRKYAGVSGLKVFPSGETIGSKWEHEDDYVDATNLERIEKKLIGDKAEAYYTKVLKKFAPIPVFENENDVEKAVLWNRIAYAGYKVRWFNEGIYVVEYLQDGMTRNIKNNYLRNFQGYSFWMKEQIAMQPTLKRKLSDGAFYIDIAKEKGINKLDMSRLINQPLLFIEICCLYNMLRKIKKRIVNKDA